MKRKIAVILLIILILSASQASAQPFKYRVRRNETMWGISKKFGIDLSQLLNENPQIKDPSTVKEGQNISVPNPSDSNNEEDKVLELVNRERANRGLQLLKGNSELKRVARKKCQDMINKNYFAHESPTYGSPFKMMESEGIRFTAAGENIAMGQPTAEQVMSAWMNSPGHRNNILSPAYTDLGVGVAKDKNGNLYWTQLFIKAVK